MRRVLEDIHRDTQIIPKGGIIYISPFMPFGGEPRVCLGSYLAEAEAKVLLQTIIKRYSVSLQSQNSRQLGFLSLLAGLSCCCLWQQPLLSMKCLRTVL
jgi:cytochrome P450